MCPTQKQTNTQTTLRAISVATVRRYERFRKEGSCGYFSKVAAVVSGALTTPNIENCNIVLNILDMKTVSHLSNFYTHVRIGLQVIVIVHASTTFTPRIITGPPNGPVLFWLAGVCRRMSSVTLPAGRPAGGRVGGRVADTARRASTVTATPCSTS